jgi:hypothetical protein
MVNWKILEGRGRGIIWGYYSGIRPEELWKTTTNLSQNSLSPGRDFNPGPPEYEAGVLTTRPRRSVKVMHILTFAALLLEIRKVLSFVQSFQTTEDIYHTCRMEGK